MPALGVLSLAMVDGFQQSQGLLADLLLRPDLQMARTRWPGFVAAPLVLLRGGEVAAGTVGEFDEESGGEGAPLFDREAGLGEGLAGARDDGEFADADGLDEDGVLVGKLVQFEELAGVDAVRRRRGDLGVQLLLGVSPVSRRHRTCTRGGR